MKETDQGQLSNWWLEKRANMHPARNILELL